MHSEGFEILNSVRCCTLGPGGQRKYKNVISKMLEAAQGQETFYQQQRNHRKGYCNENWHTR